LDVSHLNRRCLVFPDSLTRRAYPLEELRRVTQIAEQVDLILANLVRPQLIWRPAEIPGDSSIAWI
jgi:hypothetical protein